MLKLLPILLLLLCPQLVWSAPGHDATTPGTGNNVDTITVNHTVGGSCTFPIILVSVAWQDGPIGTLDSITIGGAAATFVADRPFDTFNTIELYRRVGVSTGVNAVVIDFDDLKNSITVRVSSYCGVDQSTPVGTPATAGTNSNTASVAVSSAAGELVIDAVATSGGASQVLTVGAGQTERANFAQDPTNHIHAGSDEAGASSVTVSWGLAESTPWGILGVALKPAVAATGRWVTAPTSF